MPDGQAEEQPVTEDESVVDRSVNINTGPGGASLLASVMVVCLTVWCIFLGMGKVDPALVEAWLAGPHRG